MNIFNLLNYAPEFGGGIAKHLLVLGELAKSRGDKLFIGFPEKHDWQNELSLNSEIIIIPEIKTALWSGFPGIIRKICKNHSIDILHIHFEFAQPFSLACSIKKWDIPTIYQWHNPPVPLNEFLTPQNTFKGKIKKFTSGLVARFTDKRVISHHISISTNISTLLINNKWTISEKITFLPNATSKANLDNITPKINCSSPPIIGTVANFRPEKDYETLLKAFKILINSGLRCELQLVGDGPTRANVEKLTDELGIKSSVKFLGILSDPSEAYQKFDIFVLSTHYEGHSLVLMEAMSYALPIVATRVFSIPDVLTDGVNGLLVNPSDPNDLAQALENLITDNFLYFRISEATIKNFEQQLSFTEWAHHVIALYEHLLKINA